MKTYIVFVDGVNFHGAKSVRKEIRAKDILSASEIATKSGGIVSMIWPKWPERK